jgi:hypothetical protein
VQVYDFPYPSSHCTVREGLNLKPPSNLTLLVNKTPGPDNFGRQSLPEVSTLHLKVLWHFANRSLLAIFVVLCPTLCGHLGHCPNLRCKQRSKERIEHPSAISVILLSSRLHSQSGIHQWLSSRLQMAAWDFRHHVRQFMYMVTYKIIQFLQKVFSSEGKRY